MYKKFFLLAGLICCSAISASDKSNSNSAASVSDADRKNSDDSRERQAQDYFLAKARAKFDAMICSQNCYDPTAGETAIHVACFGMKNRAGRKQADIVVSDPLGKPIKLCFKQKDNHFSFKQRGSTHEEFQEFSHFFYLLNEQQKRILPEQTEDQEAFAALWRLILQPSQETFNEAEPFLFPDKTPVKNTPESGGDAGDRKS